jgi:hypothetical protein
MLTLRGARLAERTGQQDSMVLQTHDDLRKHLEDQIHFLQSSSGAYDRGTPAEAKRLAVAVRVLVHDGKGNSKSLLGQLDMKSRLFLDTASRRPPNLVSSYTGLAGVVLAGGKSRFVPNYGAYDDIAKHVPFDEWWTGVIIADLHGREITRSELIHSVADQDGGAHVDAKLKDVYAELSRANSMGYEHAAGHELQPTLGVDFASVRQIADEVLVTLGQTPPRPSPGAPTVVVHGATVTATPVCIPLVKLGRNDPCPCGSGRKFKRCCGPMQSIYRQLH